MNTVGRKAGMSLLIVTALAVSVLTPGLAATAATTADQPAPTIVRTSLQDYDTTPSTERCKTTGGWSNNYMGTSVWRRDGVPEGIDLYPVSGFLGEPMRTGNSPTEVIIPLCFRGQDVTKPRQSYAPAGFRVTQPETAGSLEASIYCGSTPGAPATNRIVIRSGWFDRLENVNYFPAQMAAGTATYAARIHHPNTSSPINVAQCPYLGSIHITATKYLTALRTHTSTHIWTAPRYIADTPYKTSPVDGWKRDWCKVRGVAMNESPDCFSVIPPDDPTDFNTVCAAGPEPEWLSFDWVFPMIGYAADCLFNPRGGFDRDQEIPSSWNASTAGQVQNSISPALNSFRYEGGCGTVFSTAGTLLGNASISSCSWSSWAPTIRTFLSIGIYLFFGLWLIKFLMQSIQGVVNRRVASPMGDDSE